MFRIRVATSSFAPLITFVFLTLGCSAGPGDPVPGPDKQAEGTLFGAMLGAGSGAVTAAQMSAALGPGAWAGAGLGGLFGLASGLGVDVLEEDELRTRDELKALRTRAWVQEVLQDHYERRLALHPNRDIFPADVFFEKDTASLRPEGKVLLQYIARLTKARTPWSRILVTSYITANDSSSPFANSISEKRAEEISLQFVHCGVEARRVVSQSVILREPLVHDPDDHPGRYRQAIEFLPLDL